MQKPHQEYAGASSMSSVGNALRVLDLLEGRSQLRLTDVARHLGVPNSTAHRVLSALRDAGYLRQDADSARYLPGPSSLEFSRRIDPERMLARVAAPRLHELCRDLNETVNLQVLSGQNVLFLVSIEDRHRLRISPRAGTRSLAHASAGGKVLLSQMGDDEVRRLFGTGLVRLTPRTLVHVDGLLAELLKVRHYGYAINIGETDPDVHAVAVPIVDPAGAIVAAL